MQHDHPIWTQESVQKTQHIIRHAPKHQWVQAVDEALYWVLMLLAIVGNFILSVVLVPVLIALNGITLALALFIIAASFGSLFSFILHGLEKVEHKKHFMASILIPSLALINVAIFTYLTNKLIILMHLTVTPHNPLLIGLVYVVGYVTPEVVAHFVK
ncbi:hypothetical protein HY489_04710 [Candidatus Woesearchaeota archaeon]|nr:hypothetical protein [Candidatus Woesearchaeota archaeon]